MFLPVDDDGGDLLVHEEQHGQEQGGESGQEVDVPGRLVIEHGNHPVSDIGSGGLKIINFKQNLYYLVLRNVDFFLIGYLEYCWNN